MMYHDEDHFCSTIFGVLCSSYILFPNSFSILGMFSIILSLNTSWNPAFLSIPLGTLITNIQPFNGVPKLLDASLSSTQFLFQLFYYFRVITEGIIQF